MWYVIKALILYLTLSEPMSNYSQISAKTRNRPMDYFLAAAAAAAAAKSLQSCPTLCKPIDGSPPGSPVPWDSPGKITGVGCHFLLQCMKVKSESEVVQSCLTLSNPMDCSLPGSSVHGFSRQEYWSGVPLSSLALCFKSVWIWMSMNEVGVHVCMLQIQ